jgi:glycosyltransferase involved in cell wall biosynthesis
MSALRLALVTRRYWPLVGGAEMAMANLASELRRQGASPIIVTAQWDPSWPKEVVHREAPVVRLPQPRMRMFGTWRYMTALGEWLRDRADSLDLVYVSMLKHDAYAALTALRRHPIPIALRAEGAGELGDIHWQRADRFGGLIRHRCFSADAFIACSPLIEAEFREAGYPAERVHFIPNGVAIPPFRSPELMREARISLGLDDPEKPPRNTRLAVFTGRLDRAKGLGDLAAAWPAVLAQLPHARLWLVGEGPDRDWLQGQIESHGLSSSVAMPGAYDDVEDVLMAADMFVFPSHSEGMSLALLEAMAAALPIVASDIPGNRTLVSHEEHALLTPAHDAAALAKSIVRLLTDARLAGQLAAAARLRVEENFSLRVSAQRHLELFERLVAEQKRGR